MNLCSVAFIFAQAKGIRQTGVFQARCLDRLYNQYSCSKAARSQCNELDERRMLTTPFHDSQGLGGKYVNNMHDLVMCS